MLTSIIYLYNNVVKRGMPAIHAITNIKMYFCAKEVKKKEMAKEVWKNSVKAEIAMCLNGVPASALGFCMTFFIYSA